MRYLAMLFLIVPSLAFAAAEGPARVIDGDTLEIGGARIDLFGIDAPELAQTCEHLGVSWPCGNEARNVLTGVIATRHVRCRERGNSADGTPVAICAVGPESLNLEMAITGMAVAAFEAEADVKQAEAQAKLAKRGIWAGRFIAPEEWRQGKRLEPTPASARCRIKGDIGVGGKRYYHVPGSAAYDSVDVEQNRGERWFCTEMDAIRAGWKLKP